MRNRLFSLFSLILAFGLTFCLVSLVFTKEVIAAHRGPLSGPLSKVELLDGIQHWRKILKNIPGPDLRENDLQQEFLFRLQFLVERRYEGTDASFVRILDFMKELEGHPSNLSSSSLNAFLEILIKSIKEIREAQEPLWPYIQQFMVDNSLKNPVNFEETVKQRDYINQFETVSAARLNHEEINQYFISLEIPVPTKIPATEPYADEISEKSSRAAGDRPEIRKLEERPRPELPPETGTVNPSEGQTDVGPVKVIESEKTAVQP